LEIAATKMRNPTNSAPKEIMDLRNCPIETAFRHVGKKWTVNIIRDMLLGKKRFTEFLQANPEMSTKMLSQRLRDLEKDAIVRKRIVSKNPVRIEYGLTARGEDLNRVLFEMSMFSMKHYGKEVFCEPVPKFFEEKFAVATKIRLGMQ
jgi:DNA-binding HxlR family transcriptional regulator